MKHLSIILIFLASIAALTACTSHTTTDQRLVNARDAISFSDYDAALEQLDLTATQLNDSTASPTQLSELALLYMVIDNQLDDSRDCSLKALEAYRRAVKISPDSVLAYISTLDPEELQYIIILQSLSNSFDQSLDSITISDFETELIDFDLTTINPDTLPTTNPDTLL